MFSGAQCHAEIPLHPSGQDGGSARQREIYTGETARESNQEEGVINFTTFLKNA